MALAEATTITTLLSTASEVATWVWSQVTSVAETISSTPILIVTFGLLMVGGAIGIFSRLLHKG